MVPAVHEQGPRRCAGMAAMIVLLAAASTSVSVAEPRGLADVVYEFAVTSYCGLQTPEVEAGFRRELAQMTAESGFDLETARRERIQGWIAAENEWRNRGLGGQRAWCAAEGVPAARHFQAISSQP
jgi:hypothetical protein